METDVNQKGGSALLPSPEGSQLSHPGQPALCKGPGRGVLGESFIHPFCQAKASHHHQSRSRCKSPWQSLSQPGQLWCCRAAPSAVSRGATGPGSPTEVTVLTAIPVLLHDHHPSVPQFPHLESEAFEAMQSARPEEGEPSSHGHCHVSPMGTVPGQPRGPALP